MLFRLGKAFLKSEKPMDAEQSIGFLGFLGKYTFNP